MKKQIQESLDRIKYLTEFHFKSHGNKSSVEPIPDEIPIKYDEIEYNDDNDYPTYESYINNVMIDEDEPESIEQPQNKPVQSTMPEPQQAPAPENVTNNVPTPVTNNNQTTSSETIPTPPPVENIETNTAQDTMFSALEASLQKTDDMLAKFDMLQQQLAGMETVSMKLNDVEKKLDDLQNPPYEDQLEMISKKAYPYNIKLSDFWGWDEDEPVDNEDIKSFNISSDDLGTYNKDEIKKSFTT